MKYFIIAGERSGDLHGSNLIKAIIAESPNSEIQCWGGNAMEAAGAKLLKHYRDLAFMGFLEVIKNIFTIRKNFKLCEKQLLDFRPDVLILIDYAGFNLRMAKFARKNGIRVFYYISPKVWAWNQKRALKIKRDIERMFVILPFEKEFYSRYYYDVDYVGNPLVDAIADFQPNSDFLKNVGLQSKPIIALLPGSRKQEIENILKLILSIKNEFRDYEFVVAGVDSISNDYYKPALESGVKVIFNQTYDLIINAEAAVVTSGTATLETALLNTPQVVTYKTSWLSYKIAKALIKIDYISLVNLIAGKEVVRELIQNDLNKVELSKELKRILIGQAQRDVLLKGYSEIHSILGTERASGKLAKYILKYLKEV